MASLLAPNTLIGARYRLERRIGQGGMAEVWLANDISLKRKVAVKLMRPRHNDDHVVLERFRREAQLSAALNHANIVTVYDVVEDAGRQAVIMEYIDGMSLREVLDKHNRVSPALTIHVGMAVASALDAAHAKDLVHRDIKPANILVTLAGRVLLTDFGIAKALGGNESDLTNENIMMGTAKYLSPEQVRGRKLDGRADIYSLGLVLYECLSGRVPFLGESDVETALARVQRPPTDLLELRPTLPPALADVVHQMLAKNPSERPAHGEAVRAALYKIRELGVDGTPTGLTPARGHTGPINGRIPGEPEISSPASPVPPRAKIPRIAPSTVLAAAMLVGVLVLGGVLWKSLSSSSTSTTNSSLVVDAVSPGPITITKVRSYDPDGDDATENEDQVANLLDANAGTQWRTVCYGNKFFGGKEGVGFVVELSSQATGTLSVDVGHAPWSIEVFATNDVIPAEIGQWGQRIDKSYATQLGLATFSVNVPTQYILVYLREAARSPQCSTKNPFQGVINDVKFTTQQVP